ncbi:MAG: HAD hydrolase-like protein [Gemmatimonadaceae bacterium]
MHIALFDIDGTILWTDGAGRRALTAAMIHHTGNGGPESYRYDGKTDPQIVRDLMRLAGRSESEIDEAIPLVIETYLTHLQDELSRAPGGYAVLPGVMSLLDTLEQRADVTLGLLTGNVAPGARAKLSAVGVDVERFRICAYGSDHAHRPELSALAHRRARALVGPSVEADDLVVIGDTPADVECGAAVGARTIAVATGRYTVAELRAAGAGIAFEDLSDTAAVVRAVVGATA